LVNDVSTRLLLIKRKEKKNVRIRTVKVQDEFRLDKVSYQKMSLQVLVFIYEQLNYLTVK